MSDIKTGMLRSVAALGKEPDVREWLRTSATEIERLRHRLSVLESDDDTIQAVIGRVEVCGCDWEIALAPDCQTWLTVPVAGCAKRPEIGDIVTIRKPSVLKVEAAEDSQD